MRNTAWRSRGRSIPEDEPVRTSFESPWQNGVAERWVESCRRDLLDHVIAVNERHLKRLLSEYVRYYHDDRTHLGLGKGTPNCRTPFSSSGRVVSSRDSAGCIIVTIGLPDPDQLPPILNISTRHLPRSLPKENLRAKP